ncbi:RNA polymerase I specific transcription initiation factor [Akanthomyces lecanii RCEF 1005]|uniref:RNA polymerase I specific transcription initiation factor n=1 Tax=Akanthomyces lecanii RCEF 1005 TaxID=1081108 RepID=A0A168K499_CORDF|nr:RNA polymerase I specific transcription initiation factor [Akanthomyces lecanii RCEF 1005]
MSQVETNWDLDSDEIASIASEELHENRPNRWKGPKSTWRHFTEEERMLWRSMKQLQDEDLGVHLYNAFALKQRATNPETARDLVLQIDDGQEAVWAPPKMWTAWPMRQKHLPPLSLFKDESDGDDEFTFRRKENTTPSSELKAELIATILRTAKERFRRRKPPQPIKPSIETSASPRLGDQSSDSSSDNLEMEFSARPAEKQATDVSVIDDEQPNSRGRKNAAKTYDPVVSADDDLSASLLKPSVQHILSQLDKALAILHNTRVAGLSYLSDSSETETEEESETSPASTRKRGRGRPRLPPQPSAAASPGGSTSRRGRPKRVRVPEHGETQEQMELRLARLGHRRLPATDDDREAAFEEWLRQGDERVAREQRRLSSRPVSEEPESQDDDGAGRMLGDDGMDSEARTNAERKIHRWGLRDWSDVIGAAALAGFPPDVIARTTQRCANLFGQGMALSRLDEAPAARAAASVRITTYQPERIHLSASPSDSDDSDAGEDSDYDEMERAASLKQRRIASRQASLSRASREASADVARGRGRPTVTASPRSGSQQHDGSASRSQSRSRSRSVTRSSAGLMFCPLASCDRAATGFSRRANLRRHMRLVHPGHNGDAAAAAAVVVAEDSEDDTVGAVHVDGFLRTVNPGKGWRGEDALSRKRRGAHVRTATPPTENMDMASSSEDSE